MKSRGMHWFVLPALLLSLCSCTKKTSRAGTSQGASGSGGTVVNLAIWSNYIKPETLASFEKKTGIHVNVSNYSSNEELLAKLQAGASGYDVVVPSDYMVFAMIKLGLLQPLDFKQLSNFKSIDKQFLAKQFDPTNKYSVPYDWGTTGIAVNRTLYKGKIRGWKDLFTNTDLAGKMTLLDDVRETIGAALKAQGLSLNTTSPDDLKKAENLLFKVRPRVKAFTSEPMMPLVNGETAVAHAYMSDALQARRQTGGKIEYIIPEEGATLWIDNLVIPTGAQNVRAAHLLINYLLDPKVAVKTTLAVLVAPTDREVFSLLPPDLQKTTALFPPAPVLHKLEMLQDLGASLELWDRTWTEIKADTGG